MKRPVALSCFCWLLALNQPVNAQEPCRLKKFTIFRRIQYSQCGFRTTKPNVCDGSTFVHLRCSLALLAAFCAGKVSRRNCLRSESRLQYRCSQGLDFGQHFRRRTRLALCPLSERFIMGGRENDHVREDCRHSI